MQKMMIDGRPIRPEIQRFLKGFWQGLGFTTAVLAECLLVILAIWLMFGR